MISVVFNDKDATTTKDLPVLSFNGEYKMPALESYVLVVSLSNGNEAGYVLGNYWNNKNKPAVSGAGVYRKELGASAGEAYIQYSNGSITFHDGSGSATLSQIIAAINLLGV
ncbi:MAG: hypothetical protein LUC16_01485 [Coprobacillus sp.]|nr:hypothetical protein [Coprobacillus sp.]